PWTPSIPHDDDEQRDASTSTKPAIMSASAAVWPDPFGWHRITSPATPRHLTFLLRLADHRLNSLHLPSPVPPPFAPFTHSIPIGPHSGLLEPAVSAMLRSTSSPTPGLCRRSTADTALMCSRQLSGNTVRQSLLMPRVTGAWPPFKVESS